ncbi:hypothetical protein HOY80DRAFT_5792 [Tuber brumale]|nr:hypothetical protein HOY80DRAFT_5792 [Tuber brumale]
MRKSFARCVAPLAVLVENWVINLIDSDRICVFCFVFILFFLPLMHCSGERVFAVPRYLFAYPVPFCTCWGPEEGVSVFFLLPSFVSLRGFERYVFGFFFARACLKRRLLLVFSYCIVGCSFGLILGAMEFFVNASHTFFHMDPSPSLTHPFVCDAPLAHLLPYILPY